MGGIFINYRRGNHLDAVLTLANRLDQHFGRDQVFLDTSSIGMGRRYPDVLRNRLLDSEVLLAVIHQEWLVEQDAKGMRLLDRKGDWVREELELAMKAGKTIVPVLLDNTPPPPAEELPESISDLAHRQARWLRSGSRDADIDRLIPELELDVAPTWNPTDAIVVPSRRPGRWCDLLSALLSSLLLVAPPLFALDHAPPVEGETPLSFVISAILLLVLGALCLSRALVWLFASDINELESEAHAAPASRYNARLGLPLALVLCATPLIISLADRNKTGILISLAGVFAGVLYLGWKMIQSERNEDKLRREWTYYLPTPLRPLQLRQGVVLLEDRITQWSRPLSREQRDRARWMLATLDQGATTLRTAAEQRRLPWMIATRPWLSRVYPPWLAATAGFATASVIPLIRAGSAKWPAYCLPPATLALGAALALGAVEFDYRSMRWQARAVAVEVAKSVDALRSHLERLIASARRSSTDLETMPSAAGPDPVPQPESDDDGGHPGPPRNRTTF